MDLRKLKDKATQAFSRGKYEKAAELYQEYCNADAKDLQARLRMGDAWVRAGDKHRAIEAYQWAAEGYARDGFLPRAIAASKLILELDPSHTATQKTLAQLYAQKSGKGRSARPPPPPHQPQPRGKDKFAPIEIADEEAPPAPKELGEAIELDLPPPPPGPQAAPPAPGGPELTRELPPELEVIEEPLQVAEPTTSGAIEIDVIDGQPLSGEVEIPIEPVPSAPRPPPAEVVETIEPAEIVVEPEPPAPPPPAPRSPPPEPLDAPLDAPLAAKPPPGPRVYELDLDDAPADEPMAAPEAVPLPPAAAPKDEVLAAFAADSGTAEEPLPLTQRKAPAPEVVPLPGAAEEASGGPPGLKPRRHDGEEGGPRIHLPSGFGGDGARAPSTPQSVPPEPMSELERSLSAFTRFDPDEAPAAEPPRAAPPPAMPAGFTELELEGDSLLHAVEAAATHSHDPLAHHEEEETIESPEEIEPGAHVPGGALPTIPLFSDLPEDAFIALFERCPLRRFTTGETIIEQGSQGRSFFVVCAGKVKVYRSDQNGRHDLAALDEGAFFGEMALLSDAPRSASVEAADEDTQLLEISAEILTELSRAHPSVAAALKKFCRQRLLANLMASGTLFKPFSRQERRDLVARFKAREVPKGVPLIAEGKETDGLYVILSGEVEVLVGGRQVATLREGELFGEMSLLTRSPATATCRSTRRTSILRLPRHDFDMLIMSHPQILELVAELTDARKKKNARLLTEKTNATAEMI